MKTTKLKHGQGQLPNPQDPAAIEGRRTFLKLGAAALLTPVFLNGRTAVAAVTPVYPPSPPTTPWLVTLPNAITPLQAVPALNPSPTEAANTAAGEAGRAPHQRFNELIGVLGAPLLYELRAKERLDWVFHPAYPPQPIWGYEGTTPGAVSPGPTIFAHYGKPIIVRFRNQLPQDHVGFGTPEISTHLHNAHTGSESDGFPGDYYSANKAGPTLAAPGEFKDHFYPNIYAGYDQLQDHIGDPNEAMGTLFYHDHTLDFTAPNVVRGLFGSYLLFDDVDSGDELDPSPSALNLPSHPYDYPLAFADRRFDANDMLFYDQINPEGVLGDKVLVNGYIEPVLKVARRKYRLRLLNSGPSRFYALSLVTSSGKVEKFTLIANDGNLLPAPLLNQTRVMLGMANRSDIVVDFYKYPIGTVLYFVNKMRQLDTREGKDIKEPGTRVLKFIIDREPPQQDLSEVPSTLRPLPPITAAEIAGAPVRRWIFDRSGGMWTINGQLVNVKRPRALITQGRAEIWELVNPEDGWTHPIHIHFEEGQIIGKIQKGVNKPLLAHELGRKDVYVLEEFTTLRVFLRFRDFKGKYVMHCHNLIHEDHAMMLRWDIV
ncbi:multicopper oxidase domain-containing protein [Pseudomonas sp. LS44]|uniref:multicopper oxidase family protein n=1 Tax=Pseudomonas sp. LS44 TaxID=1357074 RepID=UPI00215A6696|nr:multicopper oxidase domain-containing protein [Pseudomonas sp. LS44]UVE16489.1 multicopper oxidase domain-containing protein [Pseudomonas sp. LS44]